MKTLAILALAIGSAAVGSSQAPAPVAFHCVSIDPQGLVLDMQMNTDPLESLQMTLSKLVPNSTDKTPPVITAVTNNIGVAIGNGSRLVSTANGLPLTVTASDDTGITYAALFVDGQLKPGAAAAAPDGDFLPGVFYLRWNSRSVSLGTHAFRLVLYDASLNKTERVWTMIR